MKPADPGRHGLHQQTIERHGPGRFVTRAVCLRPDGTRRVLTSRHHRKGLGVVAGAARRYPWLRSWAPRRLAWWVAVCFIVGSALFVLGGYMATWRSGSSMPTDDPAVINWSFFVGSVFFTTAAYLQVLEAINAGDSGGLYADEKTPKTWRWFAWQPERIGYLASVIQLAGALSFNFNTGDALLPSLGWVEQDLLVWTPDIIGSICFLVASYLAVMEVCHGYWAWQPYTLSWWVVMINLIGSVSFMISAVYSFVPPEPGAIIMTTSLANFFTFIGAAGFLLGSYLLLPEIFTSPPAD